MFRKIWNAIAGLFNRIGRTILVALAGQLFFLVSVITMVPLRIAENPVVNYNLFYLPILALIFFALFYRACVEQIESRGILYGYFSALVAWPLIGEVASMPLDEGIVPQFSSMNIKLLGGYFYVAVGWILLKVMWRTGAVKSSVNTFFLVFLSIWSFELYMDNYSSKVPIEMMPIIASRIATVFGIASLVILVLAFRTTSVVRKNVLGCLLYITFSLVIMGSSQWNKPSTFYVKYEAAHLDHEIKELQEEKAYLEYLRNYMIENGIAKEEELTLKRKHQEAATEDEGSKQE